MLHKRIRDLLLTLGIYYTRLPISLSDVVDWGREYVLPALLSISFIGVLAGLGCWALLIGVEIGFNLVILLI